MIELDYVVIGHVTRDLANGAFTIGGTASYAARTASALSCRVGVITSAGPDLDLGQVLESATVVRIPSATKTKFENTHTPNGRRQVLYSVAEKLTPETVPPDWQVVPARSVVHLGPVAQECDPALANAFGAAFVGLTPQGWMRCWDRDGLVSRCQWEKAEQLLARADAVIISEEDVMGDEALVTRYAAQTRLLVVTRGAAGCTVYTSGQSHHFPAPSARQVDATGSGDIFAAAFFVWLRRVGDPGAAARFANCLAARSVTRKGLSGAPSPEEIAHCEKTLAGRVC